MAAPSAGTRVRPIDFLPKTVAGVQTSPAGTVTRYTRRVVGEQRTFSQVNLWNVSRRLLAGNSTPPRKKEQIRRLDVGGNFETKRHEFWASHPEVNLSRKWIGGYYTYSGALYPTVLSDVGPTASVWPLPPSDLGLTMIQKGATAIARTIPTNPAVGVGQFLGELREGLPSIPGKDVVQALRRDTKGSSIAKYGRAGAHEYLNYEFGIRPILSDAQGFVKAAVDSDKIIQQLARDSGRLIRRRYSFPEERSIETILVDSPAFPWPPINAVLVSGTGTKTIVREVVTRTWFSGAYTYHYQQGRRLWDRMVRAEQEANRLYGLRLSPALLWELAPWSWLVDWKTNLGDVMTNISAFSRDGLVLCWGYVMCEMRITDTHTLTGLTMGGSDQGAVTAKFTTVVKKRVKATPYGFGLDPDWKDFTSRQLAILSALGITRA